MTITFTFCKCTCVLVLCCEWGVAIAMVLQIGEEPHGLCKL
ncbi:hypothetical protein ACOMICROBIO_EPCKBFOG_00626 [Vibrio sp. B1FLJ16]|nr:hypothetical protein ACOMICROBIO_FLGHMIGD_00623 [Vibrio sp. B1FLJ16]CAD7800363.1 hypothetical protein ACOMICROBIO_EPCKBFOG_00626 [Vibrio sp. B1FLJ16]CAE6887508.1 hypothetical protein ACOMICROBIO_FLGHMIGD_00623 [Vibrio sp. B1FLJ16]CAE6888408.1 hypothetical protein ACOMICROBIO_EPCKBFOG_00626 [Vibrio sp. B1FLJ16]